MLDKLFELLLNVWKALLPFRVVYPWEAGVLIRLGKFKRTVEAGFHWVIPLHVDALVTDSVVASTHSFEGATTTKDGKSIGYTVVITFSIRDIEKATLTVHEVKDAVIDTCMGVVGVALSDANWEDVLHGRVAEDLTKLCRARGWKWGIEIMAVQLAGACLVKNVRLLGQQPAHHS